MAENPGFLKGAFEKGKAGVTLVEIMVSIFIFALLFSHVFSAYAPTATDTHNLLRGYSSATAVAGWYMNLVESEIDRKGGISAGDLGKEKDITLLILEGMGEELEVMHNLQVVATVQNPTVNGKVASELYEIQVEVRWGNNFNDNRPHRFKTSRWKIRPYS